jgi:2-deoxy-D-gluconate 3-dehydrogenase
MDTLSGERKVAFITGGAFGIGAAVALALARDEFDVAVSGTRVENVAGTCAKLHALRVRPHAVALDVRSKDSVDAAFASVLTELGAIDVLVNNAGIPLSKPALDVEPDEWANVMATNVNGTFFMCQAFGRHLVERKREGLIINIGSTHGLVGYAGRAAYGTSKAAVHQLTKMLAIEWAPLGIRVNAVAPGRVESNSPARANTSSDPRILEASRRRVPLDRFCSVEDVAEAVRYFASPGASYITGHTLVLDGGLTVA